MQQEAHTEAPHHQSTVEEIAHAFEEFGYRKEDWEAIRAVPAS